MLKDLQTFTIDLYIFDDYKNHPVIYNQLKIMLKHPNYNLCSPKFFLYGMLLQWCLYLLIYDTHQTLFKINLICYLYFLILKKTTFFYIGKNPIS